MSARIEGMGAVIETRGVSIPAGRLGFQGKGYHGGEELEVALDTKMKL